MLTIIILKINIFYFFVIDTNVHWFDQEMEQFRLLCRNDGDDDNDDDDPNVIPTLNLRDGSDEGAGELTVSSFTNNLY